MTIERRPEDPRLTQVRLRRHLVTAGWSDRALSAAVRRGTLAKPRRGAYVDGTAWHGLDARGRHEVTLRAVLQQADSPLVVSHTSGLVVHDCPEWGLDLTEVDVTRRDGRGARREAGVRTHRGRILEGDVVMRHGMAVMSPTRLAIEVTTQLCLESALVQINDLLHRGLTTDEQIATRYRESMDHWPESLGANVLLRLIDGRCASVGESRTMHLCWRQGLPSPELQYPVHDETGQVVAVVDFAWPELGVFLEFDGMVKYTTMRREGETPVDVVVREKRREEMICRLTGWRCVRIVWADLFHPEQTALLIRRALFPVVSSRGGPA